MDFWQKLYCKIVNYPFGYMESSTNVNQYHSPVTLYNFIKKFFIFSIAL